MQRLLLFQSQPPVKFGLRDTMWVTKHQVCRLNMSTCATLPTHKSDYVVDKNKPIFSILDHGQPITTQARILYSNVIDMGQGHLHVM